MRTIAKTEPVIKSMISYLMLQSSAWSIKAELSGD